MYTEHGLLVDLAEIEETVRTADVFAVSFRLFQERLLIDTRHDGEEIPMVAIVDPVNSVQERFFWLGQHRPSLGMPEHFMFFYWPHSIGFLRESGVWPKIVERVVGSGFSGAGETCDAALRDLMERERTATLEAIQGQRYETLWSAR
jgi:hypothetical protein